MRWEISNWKAGTHLSLTTSTNGKVYYYHTDHLGTPLKLTDENAEVVWMATCSAFGKATILVEKVKQPLRFPGQYYDAESGLCSNGFRYYDPALGRYITQDPIGLAGGLNPYQYAPNPVQYIDPLGLSCKEAFPTDPLKGLQEQTSLVTNSENWWERFIGGAKELYNEFLKDQAAGQAEWFADQGIFQYTDRATGEILTAEEIAQHIRATGKDNALLTSAEQQTGANMVKNMPQTAAIVGLISALSTRGRSLLRDPDDLVSDLKKATKDKKDEKKDADKKKQKDPKMDPYTPKCFKPGPDLKQSFKDDPRGLEKEFFKQLKGQEKGLNDLTIGEYVEGRKRYKELGRSGTGAAQEEARTRLQKKIQTSITKNLRRKGARSVVAKRLAKERAGKVMSNLAALHDPDMIAGGQDKIQRVGDAKVNSSLGSQWPHRVKKMDQAAEKALKKHGPNAKLNINLERCR